MVRHPVFAYADIAASRRPVRSLAHLCKLARSKYGVLPAVIRLAELRFKAPLRKARHAASLQWVVGDPYVPCSIDGYASFNARAPYIILLCKPFIIGNGQPPEFRAVELRDIVKVDYLPQLVLCHSRNGSCLNKPDLSRAEHPLAVQRVAENALRALQHIAKLAKTPAIWDIKREHRCFLVEPQHTASHAAVRQGADIIAVVYDKNAAVMLNRLCRKCYPRAIRRNEFLYYKRHILIKAARNAQYRL